jgi:hypothetical protein
MYHCIMKSQLHKSSNFTSRYNTTGGGWGGGGGEAGTSMLQNGEECKLGYGTNIWQGVQNKPAAAVVPPATWTLANGQQLWIFLEDNYDWLWQWLKHCHWTIRIWQWARERVRFRATLEITYISITSFD